MRELTTKTDMERTKVDKAMIIVEGTKEKPYFEILYHEVGKDYDNIGFGSYDLNNVFDWKEQYLEVVKAMSTEEHMEDNEGCCIESDGDIEDEASKFRDKVKITYGPENREADDVTLKYLQKMSDDELLAFCGENDIRIPEEYRNRGYIIGIIKKHCLV